MRKRELYNGTFEYQGTTIIYEPFETLRTRPDQDEDLEMIPVAMPREAAHCGVPTFFPPYAPT